MKYRHRNEITATILEAANGGATKTKIMYKAYLSYAQVRDYFEALEQNDLLMYVESEKIWKTTPKGLNFLKTYAQLNNIMPAGSTN